MSSLATSSFWFEGEADVMGIYFRMEPSYGGHSADCMVDVAAFKNHNHESQESLIICPRYHPSYKKVLYLQRPSDYQVGTSSSD